MAAMIQNIKSDKLNDLAEVTLEYIEPFLERGFVNLFVSGGSSFRLFAYIDHQISNLFKSHITLYQVDERHGPVGHEQSNGRLFDTVDTGLYAQSNLILTGRDATAEARQYADVVDAALHSGRPNIAIMGVGTDQHIAGVKPGPADTFNDLFSGKLVVAYKAADFARITITPDAIRQFDAVFVYADDAAKLPVYESLQAARPIHSSPAHILNQVPEATLLYKQT